MWTRSNNFEVTEAHGRKVELGQLSLARQQQASEIHENWSASSIHHFQKFESLQ